MNKIINKDYEKTIHLHGRKEIEDFFRDEFNGNEEALQEHIKPLLEKPDSSHIGLPWQINYDGVQYHQNRRVVSIVIHYNNDK
ncbi:hypothetical protein IR083_19395 [Dysgonomonas sp. GY75]|uniref:hypothetical protein n=1 Tax=Dysgonomonas sp. GY75 TaxID=2780419 RepID=UPI0018845AF4|nr:hypothetical protein [Dysgonomonas sp. GY75]MBF0650987.1 hypothetical protein [Dysgonomonas sp. GY75]